MTQSMWSGRLWRTVTLLVQLDMTAGIVIASTLLAWLVMHGVR